MELVCVCVAVLASIVFAWKSREKGFVYFVNHSIEGIVMK
jgi:hypothetical protein